MIGAQPVPERQSSEPDRAPTAVSASPVARGLPPAEQIARGRLDASGLLALQRRAGNAAVGHVLARQPSGGVKPPDLINPFDDEAEAEWEAGMAELNELAATLRKRLLDTLEGRDAILFMSRIRALSDRERKVLEGDEEFWRGLRKHLSGVALWAVRLRLHYTGSYPAALRELSLAIHEADWSRTRTLLFAYDWLKTVPGLREVIAARFPVKQADDLRAILLEVTTRAESGKREYKEAHYEKGKMDWFQGTRNYELVRTEHYVRVIVRIHLTEDAKNKAPEITDKVVARWERGIARVWNGKLRLRSGTRTLDVWFIPMFLYGDAPAHHDVTVTAGDDRSDEHHWHADDEGDVAAHEFGHMLGNPDEYNLPATAAEIPASFKLTPDEVKRNNWKDVTGETKAKDTDGYDVPALMGSHYKSTRLHLRYAADIAATFNATLKRAGEADWVAEEQK